MAQHRFSWATTLDYAKDLHAPYPDLDEKLRRYLLKPRPQHVKLQGLPGSGKTSAILRLCADRPLVYLDMNRLYLGSTEGFHEAFAQALTRALGFTEEGDTAWRTVVQTFIAATQRDVRFLVVLDHFDRFLQFGKAQDQLGILAELLGLMNEHGNVGFVYASALPLDRLCDAIDHMSELPGRCTLVTARGLLARDTQDMLNQGLAEVGIDLGGRISLDTILNSVGRNPTLVQMCGAALAEGARTPEAVMTFMAESARGLFDQVYRLFTDDNWRAFIRFRSNPTGAGQNEWRVAERVQNALVYFTGDGSFFSALFEEYLDQKLVRDDKNQLVYIRKPAALMRPEHGAVMRAACRGAEAYEVEWDLVGNGPDPRYVYEVKPFTSSGHLLRPFFLKIDTAGAVEKEARNVEAIRTQGVVTPPAVVVDMPGGGALRGLKSDIAALNPRLRFSTLKNYVISDKSALENLKGALEKTHQALAPLYASMAPRSRRVKSGYSLQPQLRKNLEMGYSGLSDRFGSRFIRGGLMPPGEAVEAFQNFLEQQETLLMSPIHGDLHARNVIRDEHGNVQVIDFGRYREDGHLLADWTRLELSLLFEYAQHCNRFSSRPDTLAMLSILTNRARLEVILSNEAADEPHPIGQILSASRGAFAACFPAVAPREYALSLLGTLLVLLSFENYFIELYRWVAYAYACVLLDELVP